MNTYTIHLIRHGMTDGNRLGYYTGQSDVPLCKEGIAEIEQKIVDYAYPSIDLLYSSPLIRAKDTAKMVYPSMEIIVVDKMKELDMGDFTEVLLTKLDTDADFVNWKANKDIVKAPGASEDWNDFLVRISEGLGEVLADMSTKNVRAAAIFCHGGVISGLIGNFASEKISQENARAHNVSGFTISLKSDVWEKDKKFDIVEKIPSNENKEYDMPGL